MTGKPPPEGPIPPAVGIANRKKAERIVEDLNRGDEGMPELPKDLRHAVPQILPLVVSHPISP